MFRHYFGLVDGQKRNLTKNGDLSCAYFSSSILKIFGLVGSIHLTVKSTLEDMGKSGWFKIAQPKKGSILLWEKQRFGKEEHPHIGFFIGNNKAISNDFKKGVPAIHNFTYNNQRKIEAIYWNKKLER